MSNSSSSPRPIAPLNIPTLYCHNPAGLRTTINGNKVTFQWDSPHDNDGFYLNYWYGGNAPVQVTVFGTGTEIELLPNTLYNWSVRTMCDRILVVGSATVIGVPFFTGPESITCPVIDNSGALIIKSGRSARIEWTAAPGITEYIVELKHGVAMPVTHRISTNYINLFSLLPITNYDWRVKPVCAKPSNFSTWQRFTSGSADQCPAVKVFSYMDVTTGVIHWENCPAAVSYQVYMNGTLISANHPVNVLTVANLQPLTSYTFLIIPNCANGSGEIGILVTSTLGYPVSNPTNLVASVLNNDLIITWTPAINITGQIILINGSYFELGPDVNSYMILAPAPNSKIAIRVKSVSDTGTSIGAFTSQVIPSYCKNVTSILQRIVNATSIKLIWAAVSGAAGYQIRYRLASNNAWITVTTLLSEHLFAGLTPNTSYVFEITTLCETSASTGLSITESTTPYPQCPIANNVTVSQLTDTSVLVSFGLSDGKVAYEGQFEAFADDGGSGVSVESTMSPILIEGLTPDTDYDIIVRNRCIDNNNAPPTSSSVPVAIHTLQTCTAPANLVASLQTNNTELIASWDASAGATGYNFKYRRLGTIDWVDAGDTVLLTKTITTGILSALYEVMVTTLYADDRRCSSTVLITIPQVLNLTMPEPGWKAQFVWDNIEGADFYVITVLTLFGTFTVTTLYSPLNIILEKDTNFNITVQASYNGVLGAASDAYIFNSGSEVYPPDNDCVAPLIEAFKQDSSINEPLLTPGTKNDIIARIFNYNPDLRYEVLLIVQGEMAPLVSKIIEMNSMVFNGIVPFYQVPDNDYKVVVITYDGDEKYCDGSADVQSTTCLVPTGLASDNVMHTSFTMLWDEMAGALYYEVWINGVFYKAIAGPFFDFVEGEPETSYLVKIRSNCGTLLFSDFCAEVEVITAIAP